jgi:hypothetical protein
VARAPYCLPIAGHVVLNVSGTYRFELHFDDAARSRLRIDGPFCLGEECFEPPCDEAVRGKVRLLIGARVRAARFDRRSNLRISFDDGRVLRVDDGPFENWHFSNDDGLRLHGGVGRVA